MQFKFWQMLPNCSLKRLCHFFLLPTMHENEQVSLYCSVMHNVIFERNLTSPIHLPSWSLQGCFLYKSFPDSLPLPNSLPHHTEINKEPKACYYIFVYATISLELDPKLFKGRDPISHLYVSSTYQAQYLAWRCSESMNWHMHCLALTRLRQNLPILRS